MYASTEQQPCDTPAPAIRAKRFRAKNSRPRPIFSKDFVFWKAIPWAGAKSVVLPTELHFFGKNVLYFHLIVIHGIPLLLFHYM
jgi:hypothetical protein